MQISHVNLLLRERWLKAPQHGLYASYQFPRTERLADVIVGAEIESRQPVGFLRLGSKKDDGNGSQFRRSANLTADFHAVLTWDHDVEQEGGGMLACRVCDDAFRVGKNSRGNSCPFEVMLYQSRDVWIVLNDEYSALHNAYSSRSIGAN